MYIYIVLTFHSVSNTYYILYVQHEKLSQKVFEDRICKSLQTELKKYGLEENIKFITKLIHYKTADVDESYKEKAFLFQVL